MDTECRTTYRRQVTRIVNNAAEYLQSPESKPTIANLEFWDSIEEELCVFLERLQIAHEGLKRANNDMRASIKPEDYSKESEAIAEYEDKAVSAIARITQRLNKVRRIQDPINTSTRQTRGTNDDQHNIKLPKLPLKCFSGEYNDWLPFWEQFRTVVHENESLSTSDKFNYLQSVLKGKAGEAIAGFTPTGNCYDGAISLLQEEFGNTDKLVDKNMQELMIMIPVSSNTDAKGLRRIYNTVMTCTRSLTALGVSSNSYAIMLKSKLLRCLRKELQVSYRRLRISAESSDQENEHSYREGTTSAEGSESSFCFDGDKQVKELMAFIKREAEALESSLEEKESRRTSRNYITAAGLFTASAKETCYFCKSVKHQTKDCDGSHTVSQRKEMLKGDGRCFRCTNRGHCARTCFNKRLRCSQCKGWHAKSLCDPEYKRQKVAVTTIASTSNKAESQSAPARTLNLYTSHSHNSHMSNKMAGVYLQIAIVLALNPKSNQGGYIRMILDGGSQVTFIRESIVQRLGLPVMKSRRLSVLSFGCSEQPPAKECDIVRLVIKSQYDSQIVMIEAVVVPEICMDVLTIPTTNMPALVKLKLADARPLDYQPTNSIELLVGADFYWKVVTGKYERLTDRLTAVETLFGWTLQGPISEEISIDGSTTRISALQVSASEELNVKSFWDLETIGIKTVETEAKLFTENFAEKYIHKRGERYEVCLPWNNEGLHLDDNSSGAYFRLKMLTRNLSKTPEKLFEYDRAMRDLITTGIAERVSEDVKAARQYYMPHRPIYRDDKTTSKLRIVFDASAHAANCTSLNEHLSSGANLLPDILKILLNFRLEPIGLVADIEKAFLQVSLNDRDRDVHRFYWYADELETVDKLPPCQIYRMARVTFGVTSSPFLLIATLLKHLSGEQERFPESSSILKDSFYMDDLVGSAKNEIEAIRLYKEATIILKGAAMNLRKWNSNSQTVREVFPANESIPSTQKVLGLLWYVYSDELVLDVAPIVRYVDDTKARTKRSLLQIIARFYDPLGFFGPFIVSLKILFQTVWRLKLAWDDELTDELLKIWNCYSAQIESLKNFSIPRYVGGTTSAIIRELHLFADASPHAYGAVAYLKSICYSGQVEVHFLCARNRIAPLKEDNSKELTLPRLELTAALIAARLCAHITTSIRATFQNVYLWTDSRITLCWILSNSKKWQPYVANRIKEIKDLTANYKWRHCPGKDNPADLLTRGVSAKLLLSSDLWSRGPSWLRDSPDSWPKQEIPAEMPNTVILLQLNTNINEISFRNPLFPIENYSSWKRILRITAYVLRFINILQKRLAGDLPLSAEELSQAERYWIKYAQKVDYSQEIATLRKDKPIDRTSRLLTLNPFLDENGILRVHSRLQESDLSTDRIYPIILSKRSVISSLIVLDMHQRTLHGGVNLVLTRLREKFWILTARLLVKTIIQRCHVCKRLRAASADQTFAPLPRDRMRSSRPFEVTGVDYAGPLYVKIATNDVKTRKVYILLFTCAAIRAVHMELVPDLTAEYYLMAFRRFIARRGDIVANEELHGFLSDQRIRWKFIVERAPWWGGFWERLVRTVKNVLKATIGRSTLSTEELQTFLTEAESVVNSRPLTYTSDDPEDLSPLTPSHFLLAAPLMCESTETNTICEPKGAEIRQRWKLRLKMLKVFWKRWQQEYLQQLRTLHHNKGVISTTIKESDVVLVAEPSTPRILWKLAVVEKTYPGRDNKVRACLVRLANRTRLRRPIQLLYPLEVN